MSDISPLISVEHTMQEAVFQALSDNSLLQEIITGRLYDNPPVNAPFPYIIFGAFSTRNQSLAEDKAYECRFSLNLLSQAGGRREIYDMMRLIRLTLDGQNLVLSGFALVNFREDLSDAALERDRITERGTMRFRVFIEHL